MQFVSFETGSFKVDFTHVSIANNDISSSIAYQKLSQLISRVAGLVYGELWDRITCVREGFRGAQSTRTLKESGACVGYLFSNVFDTFLN